MLNSARFCSDTLDSKSTDSTPKGTPKDTPPKVGVAVGDPPQTHSPEPSSLPENVSAMFERRYSEPVAVGDVSGGEERGERREVIKWSNSDLNLVSSSLPNPSVAIQLEVSCLRPFVAKENEDSWLNTYTYFSTTHTLCTGHW